MVVFYTFSSDKTVNNREKMALLCALLHFAHGYYTAKRRLLLYFYAKKAKIS